VKLLKGKRLKSVLLLDISRLGLQPVHYLVAGQHQFWFSLDKGEGKVTIFGWCYSPLLYSGRD
jgi:hypothetical protein